MKKTKRYFVTFVLLVFAGAIAVPFLNGDDVSEFLSNPVTWMLGLLIVFILLSIVAVTQALDSIKYYVLRKEGRLDEIAELEEAEAQEDFFARIMKKIQDAKPIEKESEIELDHNYDGIHELDNNLPPWWLWGFYISIAFAVVYLIRFHVAQTAPLSIGEYEQEMAAAEVQKAEYLKNAANLVDETSVVMLENEGLIKEGATIFTKNCAVCHANDGGGGVGPNLTDQYWIHGGDIKDVFATIKYGVPAKGMIPWKDQLNAAEMQKVASFILTLQGTTPADPKEAQGDLYQPVPVPDEEAVESDSTSTEDEMDEKEMTNETAEETAVSSL